MKALENEMKSRNPAVCCFCVLQWGAVLASGGPQGSSENVSEERRLASHGSPRVSLSPWSVRVAFISVAQRVSGVSAISSSLCRIISRSTVYLRISFSTSRSSSSWSF